MELKGKKFVVVGGAGLIGSHTIDQLLEEDVKEIIVYDNFARGSFENLDTALKDPRVSIYDVGGDILSTDILESAFDGADGVFQFAALWLLQCHEYPESAFEVNVRGTFNIMQACIKKNIARLVFSSSASVYGDAITEPMAEDHPFNNKNFYGATKIASEAMLRAYHHRYGLNFVGLRYMNVYGPRQAAGSPYAGVIANWVHSIWMKKPLIVYGDGNQTRDFITVHDVAIANIKAMKVKSPEYPTYNICSSRETALNEVLGLFKEMTKHSFEVKHEKAREGEVRSSVGDNKKALDSLEWKPEAGLYEGLKKMISWRGVECNIE